MNDAEYKKLIVTLARNGCQETPDVFEASAARGLSRKNIIDEAWKLRDDLIMAESILKTNSAIGFPTSRVADALDRLDSYGLTETVSKLNAHIASLA